MYNYIKIYQSKNRNVDIHNGLILVIIVLQTVLIIGVIVYVNVIKILNIERYTIK